MTKKEGSGTHEMDFMTDDGSRADCGQQTKLHPALAAGLGAGLILHLAMLLSLPPVLRGRGAPFLPTFQKNLNAMFAQLKGEANFQRRIARGDALCFVDLGSGDGRVVFRAAKEQIFHQCIGYEINPLLHIYANMQRWVGFLGSQSTPTMTRFYRRDLWSVDLRDVDVVAVYGLGPIMMELGKKLKSELRPGSYVLSNVFSIPGWKPLHTSKEGTHMYMI